MRREDLVAFARRDWALIDSEKTRFWVHQQRVSTPGQSLALGDELRRYAMTLQPHWPSDADRAEDMAGHERVAKALRRTRSR